MKKLLLLLMVVPMFGLAQSIENTTLAGVCRQHLELEYPMDIIVNKLELDNPSAIANYNSLGCSSDLIFLGLTKDNRYVFLEKITKGHEFCIDAGTIVLEVINENQVIYYWYEKETGNLGSSAILDMYKNINE